MDVTTIIVAAITGLLTGGLGVAVVNGLFGRKKTLAEAQRVLAEAEKALAEAKEAQSVADQNAVVAATKMLESMQRRVDVVNARLDKIEHDRQVEREHYEEIIARLEAENRVLKDKIDELDQERKQQIETNRMQGKRISELLKRIGELEDKSGCAK